MWFGEVMKDCLDAKRVYSAGKRRTRVEATLITRVERCGIVHEYLWNIKECCDEGKLFA
jgi:hypothetical protein